MKYRIREYGSNDFEEYEEEKVFTNKKIAKAEYDKLVAEAKADAKILGYCEEEDVTSYCYYEQGYYSQNNYNIEFKVH